MLKIDRVDVYRDDMHEFLMSRKYTKQSVDDWLRNLFEDQQSISLTRLLNVFMEQWERQIVEESVSTEEQRQQNLKDFQVAEKARLALLKRVAQSCIVLKSMCTADITGKYHIDVMIADQETPGWRFPTETEDGFSVKIYRKRV